MITLNNFFVVFLGITIILGALIVGAIPFAIHADKIKANEFRAKCEAKNGIVLKNTTHRGKTTITNRTCVKSDSVIELE